MVSTTKVLLEELYETLRIPISPLWIFSDLRAAHWTRPLAVKPYTNTIFTKYMLAKSEFDWIRHFFLADWTRVAEF